MQALETLELDGNQMLSGFFPETSGLKLVTITASRCNFTQVGSLSTSLQYLDLSFNQLSELPEGVEALGQLQTLLLQNNKIREWPLCGVATTTCVNMTYLPQFKWDELRTLVISNNPLGVTAQLFVDSLSYLQLADLRAANCSIIGDVVDFELHKEQLCASLVDPTRPWVGFKVLQSVDLSSNQLSAIPSPPKSLREATLAGNNLTSLLPCWLHPSGQLSRVDLRGNPELFDTVSSGVCSGAENFVADMSQFKQVEGTLYECTVLCPLHGGGVLQVDGWTFDNSSQCRCAPGNGGHGTQCTKCPKNTYWKLDSAGMLATCICPDDSYLTEGQCVDCPLLTGTEPGQVAHGPEA